MSTPWWRSASVYQLYVRSFADSNGDGIGDLRGIRDRIPYIASLGVDAIWLNPCFPSPQIDHGYDVADYFDIEPAYGDLADFDALVAAAHEHGIRILMDVVPNHCSWDHAWFKAAVAAGPGSPERKRFYFRPGRGTNGELPPNNWGAIFGGSAWTRVTEPDGKPGEWYLGIFTAAQPDWNFDSPDVIDHFDRMLRFWFDRGVDGFRADAVTMVGKAAGLPDWDEAGTQAGGQAYEPNPHFTWLPHGHDVWRHWRSVVDDYERTHPGRELLLVAEAYRADDPEFLLEYANADEFHQAFAFDLMLTPWKASVFRRVIDGTLTAFGRHDALPAWTLNNHDTQRTVSRYGREDIADRHELFPGAIINTNVAIDEALGAARSRAAALLELALPGCVYLYAGEELALPEVLDLPPEVRQDPVFHNTGGATLGRDGCRIPLPWNIDPSRAHGFSSVGATAGGPSSVGSVGVRSEAGGSVATPWLPQPEGWGSYAVEAQEGQPDSMLAMYRAAGAIRRSDPNFTGDSFEWISEFGDDLVAFRRGEAIVVLNVSSSARPLDAEIVGARSVLLSSVFGHGDASTVPGNATLWLS